jgi:hypothetical protein
MSGFVGKLQRFLSDNVPWFLQDPNGGAFLEALGLTLDNGTQTLLTGLRQSNPLLAFVDNLQYIGADRSIRRYSAESVQSYRGRLQRWRQIRHFVGTHYGQLINLQPYFLPGRMPLIRIVHQMGDGSCATWHTMSAEGVYSIYRATPSNWSWDASTGAWSRFWVIIYVDGIGPDTAVYGDGTTYGDGSTIYGGHLTSAQIADIVSIINDSKAAHSILAGLILATDPTSFDPTGSSVVQPDGSTSYPDGNWATIMDPTTGLPTRLNTAIFPYEIGVL